MTPSTTAFERPIRICIRPSNWVIAIIILAHLGAVFCVYSTDIRIHLAIILWLIIFLSLIRYYIRFIYQLGVYPPWNLPAELLLNNKDEWFISDRNGDMNLVELLSESYVHRYLVVLNFKQGKHKRSVVLTSDIVPEESFRRLRVRLKFSLVSST